MNRPIGEDTLQVRCILDGALWACMAQVLDEPRTIIYAVAESFPQAIYKFRQSLAAVIDEADRNHEEFPVIAARLTELRWRRLEFVRVKA